MSTEFELLYKIQTMGVEALDGVARAQQQISLQTKYSNTELRDFQRALADASASGQKLGTSLREISRYAGEENRALRDIARDVIANDRARQQSMEQTARVAKQAAEEEQRAANATFQMNMRIWKQEEAERKRIATERERESTERERQSTAGIRGASMMLGMGRGNPALATSLGGGITGTLGGLAMGAGAGAVFGLASMARDAAQSAQELTNLSNEFGITTQKAFQLQAAARQTGVDVGTMGAAMRKLSEAIEEPGTTGKQTAEALSRIGVSIRNGLGTALTETFDKLAAIKDPAERAREAIEIFGRDGAKLGIVAQELDKVGVSMDDNVTRRLTEANKTLEQLHNTWTVFAADISAGVVIPLLEQLRSIAGASTHGTGDNHSPTGSILNNFGTGSLAGWMQRSFGAEGSLSLHPDPPGAPKPGTLSDSSKLAKLLAGGDGDTREGIQEKIQQANKELADARERAKNDIGAHADQSIYDKDAQTIQTLQSRLTSLQAQQKRLTAGPAADRRGRDIVEGLEDRELAMQYPEYEYGSLGRLQGQQRREVQRLQEMPDLDPKLREQYVARTNSLYNRDIIQEARRMGTVLTERNASDVRREGGLTATTLNQNTRAWMNADLGPHGSAITEYERDQANQRENAMEDSRFLAGRIQSGFAYQSTVRRASGNDSPGADYSDAVAQAKELYDLRMKEISAEQESDRREMDAKRALYSYISEQDDARIKRAEQISQIGLEQQQEGGRFFSGWAKAAISGQPGASTNYLRGFGQDIFGKIVENGAGALLGSGGLNNFTSLGKSGVLGTPDNRSFIGQMVKGTPLDFAASELSKDTPLLNSQKSLKDSIDALTASIGGKPPAGSTVSGVATAVRSGNPASALSSIAGLASAAGGGGTRSLAMSAGSLPSLASMIGAGGTAPFIPSGSAPIMGSDFGGISSTTPNASLSIDNPGGSAPGHDIPYTGTGWTPSLGNIPNVSIGGKIAGGAGQLAGLIGNTGRMLKSGDALGGVLTGNIDYGDGTGSTLTDGQRVAGGIGLAAAATSGVLGTAKQFGQGGARGIVGGTGSALETAAMFDPDPLTRTALSAGGMIMGLVGSLFPDPRQERIKQEQKTLVEDQYIRPAAREYNFGGAEGAGGYSLGMGGSLRAGGPSSNYTINFSPSTLHAQSFVEWMKSNPNAAGEALMAGLTDSGISAIGGQVAWNAANGGYVPPGGLVAG